MILKDVLIFEIECFIAIVQEMNMNFRTIIIPEALKAVQAEDPSVLDALAGLEKVIEGAGKPLDALLSQLDTLHRNAIMGMQVGVRGDYPHHL